MPMGHGMTLPRFAARMMVGRMLKETRPLPLPRRRLKGTRPLPLPRRRLKETRPLPLPRRRLKGTRPQPLPRRGLEGDETTTFAPKKTEGNDTTIFAPKEAEGDQTTTFVPKEAEGSETTTLAPKETEGNETTTFAPNETEGNETTTFAPKEDEGDETTTTCDLNCRKVDCGQVAAPINGTVIVYSTYYRDIASFPCNDGFFMAGSSTTSCNVIGHWDIQTPRCLLIDCGDLTPPLNGYVGYANSTFNATATYDCDIGFVMAGSNVTTCNSSGKWNEQPPNCTMIDCGNLSVPEYGFMIMSKNVTVFGANAKFSCATGYDLIASAERSCLSNGTWSGSHPFCTERNGSNSTEPDPVPCACPCQKDWSNLTNDQIIELLVNTLSIDKDNTTLAKSKLQCRHQ